MLYQLSYSGGTRHGRRRVRFTFGRVVRSVFNTDNVEHPKAIGDRTTLTIMTALAEAG